MKYKKEIMEWMNGTPIQWKNYKNPWTDLPAMNSEEFTFFTVDSEGFVSIGFKKNSLDLSLDYTIEFRIKPDPVILTHRNAVVQTQSGTFKIVTVNDSDLFKENEVFFFNGETFIGWVGEPQEIDLNTLVMQ